MILVKNLKNRKTIDEAIRNSSYSEINLYYNHYNSSTSFEFKNLLYFLLILMENMILRMILL